jgi:hypothetical protein
MSLVAVVVAFVLCSLAALHLYWAAGGRWGARAAVPERAGAPLFEPSVAACIGVAALLFCAAALVCAKASGWSPSWLPGWWSTVGTGGVAIVLVGRAIGDFRWVGFFKRIRDTRFARLDTAFYSPLCLALGVGAALVAAGVHR